MSSATPLRPDIRPLSDSSMKDATHFDDSIHYSSYDSDQMIFGPLDLEDVNSFHTPTVPPQWYSCADIEPGGMYNPTEDTTNSASLDLATWINDPEFSAMDSPSSPIPIPFSLSDTNLSASSSFDSYQDHTQLLPDAGFLPTSFAALHPLSRSLSPSSPYKDAQIPSWATQFWDEPSAHQTQNLIRPSVRPSPLTDASTLGQHTRSRRSSVLSGQLFQSFSAPSHTETLIPAMTRTYSKREDSASISDDRDATVRRRKRSLKEEIPDPSVGKKKLVNLHPPKLAPSTWQLYFTDWIKQHQASGTRKLNIADVDPPSDL